MWYDRKFIMDADMCRNDEFAKVFNSALAATDQFMERKYPGVSNSFKASVKAPCHWKKYNTEWNMLIWEHMITAEPDNPEVIEYCKPYFLMNEINDHIAELDQTNKNLDEKIETSEREFKEALAEFDRRQAIAERELKVVERDCYLGLVEAGKLLPQETKLDKIKGFFRR